MQYKDRILWNDFTQISALRGIFLITHIFFLIGSGLIGPGTR